MFLFVCNNKNIYSIVSLVTKNLSTYIQRKYFEGFIGWPCSQETYSLINRTNMHSQYKKGYTQGHLNKAIAIQRRVVTMG